MALFVFVWPSCIWYSSHLCFCVIFVFWIQMVVVSIHHLVLRWNYSWETLLIVPKLLWVVCMDLVWSIFRSCMVVVYFLFVLGLVLFSFVLQHSFSLSLDSVAVCGSLYLHFPCCNFIHLHLRCSLITIYLDLKYQELFWISFCMMSFMRTVFL